MCFHRAPVTIATFSRYCVELGILAVDDQDRSLSRYEKAAVDGDQLAIDVTPGRAREQKHEASDILGLAGATEMARRIGTRSGPLEVGTDCLGEDRTGENGVRSDVVPCEIERAITRELI